MINNWNDTRKQKEQLVIGDEPAMAEVNAAIASAAYLAVNALPGIDVWSEVFGREFDADNGYDLYAAQSVSKYAQWWSHDAWSDPEAPMWCFMQYVLLEMYRIADGGKHRSQFTEAEPVVKVTYESARIIAAAMYEFAYWKFDLFPANEKHCRSHLHKEQLMAVINMMLDDHAVIGSIRDRMLRAISDAMLAKGFVSDYLKQK